MLLRLSDELLSSIFKHAIVGLDHVQRSSAVLELSILCRRTRRVIQCMRVPTLILSDQCLKKTRAMLKHSAGWPLAIDLTIRDAEEDPTPFLNVVAQECQRWKEFHFRVFSFDNWTEALRRLAARCNSKFYLPALETLTIDLPMQSGRNHEERRESNDYGIPKELRFYEKWITPALRELETRMIYPSRTQDAFNLQSCTVTLSTGFQNEWTLEPLAFFLGSTMCRNLTFLYIDLSETDFASDTLPDMRLDKLKTFHLHIHDVDSTGILHDFFIGLFIPNVEVMEFHMNNDICMSEPETVDEWLANVLLPHNSFDRLHSFVMKIYHCRENQAIKPFYDVFGRLRNLQNLTIIGNLETSTLLPDVLPPLRVLRLHECYNLGLPFLEAVHSKLVANPEWERFELLDVVDCPMLAEEEVKELFPPEKVRHVLSEFSDGDISEYETPEG